MATATPTSTHRAISLGLAAFAALYLACFGAAVPSFIDEAFTFNLATDRSLTHMLAALGDGADGSSPLFAIFVFVWEKIFGPSEASLRAAGGLFVVLFVWHTGSHLVRRFPPGAVVLAILLVLANGEMVFQSAQARFYGFVLCAFSLAFWSTVRLIEEKVPTRKQRWAHAGACGLVWLSHPFGMIYGSLLGLLYAGFAWRRGHFSRGAAVAFLGGPLCFVPWLPIFLAQRQVHPVFPAGAHVPGWQKYWDFAFLRDPVFCGVCALGVVLFLAARREARGASHDERGPSQRWLVVYALAFIALLNVTVAALDAAGVIGIYMMQAQRYVLVTTVAYAVIFSATVAAIGGVLREWLSPKPASLCTGALHGLAVLLLLAQLVAVGRKWHDYKSERESYLEVMAADANDRKLEVICENQADAFFLATRTQAAAVKYLLDDGYHSRTLMFRLQKHYPRPVPTTREEALRAGRDFVLIRPDREARIIRIPPASPPVASAQE